MIKRIAVILLLLLFSCSAGAKFAIDVNSTVFDQGSVTAVGGQLGYVAINITVAQQRDYQSAEYSAPYALDGDGNALVSIVDPNPKNPFTYAVRTDVNTKSRLISELPADYRVPKEFLKYANATQRIQSGYPAIESIARQITANSTDDFERAAKLAEWVNGYITYDESTAGKWYDAVWVLENKRGVCVEYATLYAAMARSIGIPTRMLVGYAYDDQKNDWVWHAWDEVYLGKWVPVDPTWGEIGWLDAMHIETGSYVDNETGSNAYVLTTADAKLDFEYGDGLNPSEQVNISLNGVSYGENEVDDLQAGASTLNFGASSVVYAVIHPNEYAVANFKLATCSGSYQTLAVEDSEKNVILEPGKTAVVSWVVKSNPNLKRNYIFTCPLVLNSNYFNDGEVSVEVRDDAGGANFDAWVSKSSIKLGEEQTLYVDVKSNFVGELSYASESSMSLIRINGPGTYQFTFTPDKVGLNDLKVFTSLGGAEELTFWVINNANLSIEKFELPSVVMRGELVKVNATFRNDGPTAKNVKATLTAGDYKQVTQLSLVGEKEISLDLVMGDAGESKATLSMESDGAVTNITVPVTVFIQPAINISKVSFFLQNGSVMGEFLFSVTGEVDGGNLSIDGKRMPFSQILQSNMVVAQLDPGPHTVTLSYYDPANNSYALSESVDAPSAAELSANESAFGIISLPGSWAVGIMMAAAVLLIIVLMLALVLIKIRARGRQPPT